MFDLGCNLATGEDEGSSQINSDSETDAGSVCFYNKFLFAPSKLYSIYLIVRLLQTNNHHHYATAVFFADTINDYMFAF